MTLERVKSQEGLGQFTEDPDKRKAGLARIIVEAARTWTESYPDIPLSSTTARAEKQAIETPKSAFEIPTVSKELYEKTREALAKEGFTFVVEIKPASIDQLVTGTKRLLFGYINPAREMRSNISPQIEVAIDPNNFRIEDSNNLSTDDQIEKIKEREAILKGKLPKDVRDVISMLKPPKYASILAQLDFEHQTRTGRAFFTNWFGRTDDQVIPGSVAHVGRFGPTSGLLVRDWARGDGRDYVFAVSAVVLPRQLAV